MANLGRWLGHMWKRVQPEENPNPTRSFAAVVRSPVMSRRDASSAPSGAAAGRQPPSSAPPPIARSPSGGAPGFTPGVYQPIGAVQTAAPQAVLTPSQPAPVQPPPRSHISLLVTILNNRSSSFMLEAGKCSNNNTCRLLHSSMHCPI